MLFLCDSNPFNQRFVSIYCHLIVYITAYNETPMNRNPSSAPLRFLLKGTNSRIRTGEGEANGRVWWMVVDVLPEYSE